MMPLKTYCSALCFTVLVLFASLAAPAQTAPLPGNDVAAIYDRLFAQIETIAIFDGHGHVGYPDDPDVDAMVAPPGRTARRLGDDNPELVEASKELFGYPYDDLAPEHAQWLVNKKAELKKQYGNEYFTRILDQLKIETSVANRVAMPDYLSPNRFKWVCFVDNLLFPFANRNIATNPDLVIYMPLQEKLLKRNMARVGVRALPDTFDGYLAFAQKLLETNKAAGAIGIKFEIAYFRSLHFEDPPKQHGSGGGEGSTKADYVEQIEKGDSQLALLFGVIGEKPGVPGETRGHPFVRKVQLGESGASEECRRIPREVLVERTRK
jgi:hypothetical protein